MKIKYITQIFFCKKKHFIDKGYFMNKNILKLSLKNIKIKKWLTNQLVVQYSPEPDFLQVPNSEVL